jgi:hypothetical protein
VAISPYGPRTFLYITVTPDAIKIVIALVKCLIFGTGTSLRTRECVILQTLRAVQLLYNMAALYGTRRFIIA